MEREKGISAIILPQKKNYYGNWIAKIEGLKKEKNWTVARVMLCPQTILPYFYKLLLWLISYFSSRSTNNIIFLFTNNYSSHQQFMKVFVKKIVSLAFCQKWRIKKKKTQLWQLNCQNWSKIFFFWGNKEKQNKLYEFLYFFIRYIYIYNFFFF